MADSPPDALNGQARRDRGRRLQLALGAIFFGAGFIILNLDMDSWMSLRLVPQAKPLVALGSMAYGGAILLLLYLRGDIRLPGGLDMLVDSSTGSEAERELEAVRRQVGSIVDRLDRLSGASTSLTSDERSELVSAIRQDVGESLSKHAIESLRQEYLAAIADKTQIDATRRWLAQSVERLSREIGYLARRGNLNLVIGVITTSLAVGLLVYQVTGSTGAFTSLPDLLSFYVPRITTVVFIEVFAFFFLRLYRTSLIDTKFYQNEITSLQMRAAALEAALARGNDASIAVVLAQLARADRNASAKTQESGAAAMHIEPKEIADLVERAMKLASGKDGK